MNKRQLAKACKVSIKSVDAWELKGCPCTRTKAGGYQFDLAKVQRWRAENMRQTHTAEVTPPASYSASRARKEAALANMRELQYAEKIGQLVRRDAVERRQFALARQIRENFGNLPSRVSGPLASMHDQHAIFTMLKTEIDQILEALSHEDPEA